MEVFDEKIKKIHRASMEVLEKVGVQFHHKGIITLLKKNGIKVEGETAYFKENEIMSWIKKAPDEFNIYARNSEYNMVVGGNNIEFVSSNSGFPLITEYDGTERPAVYDDYIKFLKLVHKTDYFNINGGVMVTPSDIGTENVYPLMLYSTIEHSDKCIFGGMGSEEEVQMSMDILKILFGEEKLKNKPRTMTIISSTSPLQFDFNMLNSMIKHVENGQAVIISPAVMAGTTGPVTIAGTIVVSNAESLAGVAVTQMLKEGTPVVYGSASSSADMRDGSFCIGAPESSICVEYCAKLAKFYGLPSRGGGTLNDAKVLSPQAGYESMMVMQTAVREGMNFVLHSAGSLGGYTSMSFEKYIMDVEIISMVKKCTEDLSVTEEDLAVKIIEQVGPAGEFLTNKHTFKNFKKSIFIPDLSIRGYVTGFEAEKLYKEKIDKKMDKMMEDYEKPYLDAKVKKQIKSYLTRNGFN